ncbi:hypothetical protein LXL04_001202 [Taraxacum kok-saghyz]
MWSADCRCFGSEKTNITFVLIGVIAEVKLGYPGAAEHNLRQALPMTDNIAPDARVSTGRRRTCLMRVSGIAHGKGGQMTDLPPVTIGGYSYATKVLYQRHNAIEGPRLKEILKEMLTFFCHLDR